MLAHHEPDQRHVGSLGERLLYSSAAQFPPGGVSGVCFEHRPNVIEILRAAARRYIIALHSLAHGPSCTCLKHSLLGRYLARAAAPFSR